HVVMRIRDLDVADIGAQERRLAGGAAADDPALVAVEVDRRDLQRRGLAAAEVAVAAVQLLPHVRIELPGKTLAGAVGPLFSVWKGRGFERAPGDEVEDEGVLGRLRRHQPEALQRFGHGWI